MKKLRKRKQNWAKKRQKGKLKRQRVKWNQFTMSIALYVWKVAKLFVVILARLFITWNV
jgi:hypothetical protein